MILENNHAGLWIHTLEDQSLVSASIGNHGGHRSERVVCRHTMSCVAGVKDVPDLSHRMEDDDDDGGPEDPEKNKPSHKGRGNITECGLEQLCPTA